MKGARIECVAALRPKQAVMDALKEVDSIKI